MNMLFMCWNAYLIKFNVIRPSAKEKYAICVCDDENKPLFFLISSNPRTRFSPVSQMEVSSADLFFLRNKSYINIAEVITCVDSRTGNVIKDFGTIPEHIKQKIKIIVKESETLPERFIDIITNKLWINDLTTHCCGCRQPRR